MAKDELAEANAKVARLEGLLAMSAMLLDQGISILKELETSRDAARDVILVAYNEWHMGTRENAIAILKTYMDETKDD